MLTVMGEALVDIVRKGDAEPRVHPGGSPLNVAVGLSRLGHETAFVGRYGRDEHGRAIDAHLRESGVRLPVGPDEDPTSVAEARIGENGAADYEFRLDWNLDAARDQLSDLLEGSELLHVGSIGAMLEPGATTVLDTVRAARGRALVSYDPNCRPTIVPDSSAARRWAESVVEQADVVKASDEDLLWLYPHRTVEETAEAWLALDASLVVVTRGELGPWALTPATAPDGVRVEAPKVEVVDTVGAGDSLMAGLLAALADRGLVGPDGGRRIAAESAETVREILDYAARAAAITVSREGANPPTAADMEADRKKENHRAGS